jgi:hypothetical protein
MVVLARTRFVVTADGVLPELAKSDDEASSALEPDESSRTVSCRPARRSRFPTRKLCCRT